jgi:hypothetical protein
MTLAAPQAQAGAAYSTAIVIRSIPTLRIAPQDGPRHWQRPTYHPQARHQRHHVGHHPRWHAAAPRWYRGGRQQPWRHLAHRQRHHH